MSVQLVSKISNLCDHNPPTLQTDRRTDGQTDDMRSQDRAFALSALRGKKKINVRSDKTVVKKFTTVDTDQRIYYDSDERRSCVQAVLQLTAELSKFTCRTIRYEHI